MKFTLKDLRYKFDCMMSRGPVAVSVLLFAVTALLVILISLACFLFDKDHSFFNQMWLVLMHTLDTGNLAANPTSNIPYVAMMAVATFCGLFITSTLIGLISAFVKEKFEELAKGTSVIQEVDHTVIIGFDNNTYTLISQLLECNRGEEKRFKKKNGNCIVVLGNHPRDEMTSLIASHFPDTGSTRIICRSGVVHEEYALIRCAVEKARSVIVNIYDDADTVKVLLALSTYLKKLQRETVENPNIAKKKKWVVNPDLHFVASVQNQDYEEAARIAGAPWAEIIYTKETIAKIIANTCRHHGLSKVLTEIMNFEGNEMYFETVPSMTGKTFREAIVSFSNAIPMGICTKNEDGTYKAELKPDKDTKIKETDMLIIFEESRGAYNVVREKPAIDKNAMVEKAVVPHNSLNNLLVLGTNDKLKKILEEFDKYVASGTKVTIVDNDFDENQLSTYENIGIECRKDSINLKLLNELIDEGFNNILLLNDDSEDVEVSDSKTLLYLILLRDIVEKRLERNDKRLYITTEMKNTDNQRLASLAKVDDFVIGSNYICLFMAQISENRKTSPIISELLSTDGAELYLRPVTDYIEPDKEVNMYTVADSVSEKDEVFVGYKLHGSREITVNPEKTSTRAFGTGDKLIVMASK